MKHKDWIECVLQDVACFADSSELPETAEAIRLALESLSEEIALCASKTDASLAEIDKQIWRH